MWRGLYLRTLNCATSVILATVLHQLQVMAGAWREIQKEDFCLRAMQHIAIHAPSCTIVLYHHHAYHYFIYYYKVCRSRWPRPLRRGSAAARLLGLRVRNPQAAGMSVYSECCVFSSRYLRIGLISRAEVSYQMRCVWKWTQNFNRVKAEAYWAFEP